MKDIVIVGAGGFGREVLQYLKDIHGEDPVKGFLDDVLTEVEPASLGQSIIGKISDYVPAEDEYFVLAIGNPVLRFKLARELSDRGAQFISVIHPQAYIASSATLGNGCIVAPFATIGANAILGDHVVLTFYSSVAHDAVVGDATALSPHSVSNGGTRLGIAAFLGTAAIVNPTRSVGDFAKVAAGSVVYRDVPPKSLASGNPARSRPLLGD